jgi:hypothetical protein
MSDFAEHWSYRLMPEMRRKARLAAIRLITAAGDDLEWESFNAALAGLEAEAHRLGASHMPEGYQRALHDELRRELVDSISAVLAPWHEAELRAGLVGADIQRWDRAVREWAQLSAPSGQAGDAP